MIRLGDDVLEQIELTALAANGGMWRQGKYGGTVVSNKHTVDAKLVGADCVKHYGGHLVGESIERSNIAHIIQAQPAVVLAMVAEIRRLRAIDLRDQFAGQALQGILASPQIKGNCHSLDEWAPSAFAEYSYGLADAMLAYRAKEVVK